MNLFAKVNGGEVIIFTCIEYLVVVGEAWGYQLCHSSFYNSFDGLGVLELIADRYPVASTYQLRKIGVQGVVRKARQFDMRGRTICTLGQHDIQDPACYHRILAKGLVKISHTKQQQGAGVLGLDRIVLLHQGSFLAVFGFAHA